LAENVKAMARRDIHHPLRAGDAAGTGAPAIGDRKKQR
jgi:hypothetical protein